MYFEILHCGCTRVKRSPTENLAEAARADPESKRWEKTMFAFPGLLLIDSRKMAGSQRGRFDSSVQMVKFRLIFGFSPEADKEPD